MRAISGPQRRYRNETGEAGQGRIDQLTTPYAGCTIAPDTPIRMSIPITLDDKPMNLLVFQQHDPVEAVAVFCQEHFLDDVSGCIRQLLPDVLDRLGSA